MAATLLAHGLSRPLGGATSSSRTRCACPHQQCTPPWARGRTRRSAAATDDDDVIDLGNFQEERLLRTCLTRHLLRRVVEAAPDTCLAQLGITRLRAPPTPPPLAALAHRLVRCATRAGALAVLAGQLGPPEPYTGYETPAGRRCLLAPGELVQRFLDPRLEAALTGIFAAIQEQRAPLVTLGPHCLFHAHLFLHQPHEASLDTGPRNSHAPHSRNGTGVSSGGIGGRDGHGGFDVHGGGGQGSSSGGGGVGLLFHACEYPAWHPESFPFRLGHCQEGSPLAPAPRQLETRNVLWYQGQLLVLDVSAGLPLRSLLWGATAPLATLYEEDWGEPLADLTLDVRPGPPQRVRDEQQSVQKQRGAEQAQRARRQGQGTAPSAAPSLLERVGMRAVERGDGAGQELPPLLVTLRGSCEGGAGCEGGWAGGSFVEARQWHWEVAACDDKGEQEEGAQRPSLP